MDAVVWIKRSAALTHKETGRLDARLADAIVKAADEVLAGKHRDQFIVDVYQAGAGTSHNMNVNEVLANRANEMLGGARGTYPPVHPERSRQHGAEHQRRDSHGHASGRARHAAGASSTALDVLRDRSCWRKGASSTTSSSRAAPTCRTRRRSGWARSSPPTATPCSGTAQKLAQAADWLRELDIGGTAVGTGHQRRAGVSRAHGASTCGR